MISNVHLLNDLKILNTDTINIYVKRLILTFCHIFIRQKFTLKIK